MIILDKNISDNNLFHDLNYQSGRKGHQLTC